MMTQQCITEDTHHNKFLVRFSNAIEKQIDSIYEYHQNQTEALYKWNEYIDEIVNYISNPSIAWDYANQHIRYPNGARFISVFNYNVGYTIKTNSHGAYVYIFQINLNPQEFGLKVPPTIKENKQIYKTNIMKTNKKVVRLTESKLRNIITESIKKVLSEGCWYGDTKPFETIIIACNEIKNKFKYVNDEDYEDFSDDHNNYEVRIYQWAESVEDQAESWLSNNVSNMPIGEYPY